MNKESSHTYCNELSGCVGAPGRSARVRLALFNESGFNRVGMWGSKRPGMQLSRASALHALVILDFHLGMIPLGYQSSGEVF